MVTSDETESVRLGLVSGPITAISSVVMTLRGFIADKCAKDAPSSRLYRLRRAEANIGLHVEYVGQHLRSMIARIDFVVNAFDSTAGVDKEADALGVPRLDAVAGPISQGDLMADIAE